MWKWYDFRFTTKQWQRPMTIQTSISSLTCMLVSVYCRLLVYLFIHWAGRGGPNDLTPIFVFGLFFMRGFVYILNVLQMHENTPNYSVNPHVLPGVGGRGSVEWVWQRVAINFILFNIHITTVLWRFFIFQHLFYFFFSFFPLHWKSKLIKYLGSS